MGDDDADDGQPANTANMMGKDVGQIPVRENCSHANSEFGSAKMATMTKKMRTETEQLN